MVENSSGELSLSPFNAAWRIAFEQEAGSLARIPSLRSSRAEHIGSSSVEGMTAQPVIDIMIELPTNGLSNELIDDITALGYDFFSEESGLAAFEFTKRRPISFNLTLVKFQENFWSRAVLIRHRLRGDLLHRDGFLKLKQAAVEHHDSLAEYERNKKEFLDRLCAIPSRTNVRQFEFMLGAREL